MVIDLNLLLLTVTNLFSSLPVDFVLRKLVKEETEL